MNATRGTTTEGTAEPPLRAVIWVAASEDWERHAARCADYCQRLGYEVIAVVAEAAGGKWDDVDQIVLTDGRAEVVVVSDRDQPPRNRTPRIEVVADERHRLAPRSKVPRPRPEFLRRTAEN